MTYKRAHNTQVLSGVSLFITILAILLTLAIPPDLTGGGQTPSPPLFLPAVPYGSGGVAPQTVVVADVNRDGKPDLVIANVCADAGDCSRGTVGVLLGVGDGTFQPAAAYDSGGIVATSVSVADLNGDGKPDIAVTNCAGKNACGSSQNGVVGILLGNGDGTFQPVVTYDTGAVEPLSVAIADLNGDGRPDLAVANFIDHTKGGGSIGILLGNGDGTFQTVTTIGLTPIRNIRSISIADVNGDGKADLLLAAGAPVVLLGNGDGTFQEGIAYGNTVQAETLAIATGDVDGDGNPDLVVTNDGPCATCTSSVGVLLGNGDGTFRSEVTYDSGGVFADSVAVADVNGDGKPDVVVANCAPNGVPGCDAFVKGVVGVLLGRGDGTFQPVITFQAAGANVLSIAVADVNGDAKPDLMAACSDLKCGFGAISVLLNNTPFDTTPPAITLFATPKVLWPPNGKMVAVTISGTITDTGSGVNANSAAYLVKDEYGEVQPMGGITLGPEGNYSFTVLLQALRRGSDLDGRRYMITVRAKDNAGNAASKTSAVTVPHDQAR